MRASNTILATAIALLLVMPAWPTAIASHEPSAHIASPKEGGALDSDGSVWITYENAGPNASVLTGEVSLDGVRVASFSQPLENRSSNTTFAVAIDASSLSAGERTLQATMQADDGSAAATTQAVHVLLQHPPIVQASAHYDRDNATLTISGTATDDEGPVTLKISTPLGSLKLNASGEFSALQKGQLKVGNHSVTIQATDLDGITRWVDLLVSVEDREAVFEDVVWSVQDGVLRVVGSVSDPDSDALDVTLRVPGESVGSSVKNGSFSVASPPLRPGNHSATLVSHDGLGGTSELTHSFRVAPTHRVLYDETIRLDPGVHVSIADFVVPAWFEGNITICGITSYGNCTLFPPLMSGSVRAMVSESGTTSPPIVDRPMSCGHTSAGIVQGRSSACGFRTTAVGGFGLVSWNLAGVGSVRVIVEGTTY